MMSQNPDNPVTFSQKESDEIHRQLDAVDEQPVCPRCGEPLTVRGPIAGGYCYVKCSPCGKSGLVTVPEEE
jgi:tRNA(Ile2) C34 agmatinyltransferase TiaS